MKKTLLSLAALFTVAIGANAQDTPLTFSGSADAYYKYDFSKPSYLNSDDKLVQTTNIGTSFANEQNSVSIGMIDLALKKTTGKASFVGEVSFGPRGQGQSIPNAFGGNDEIVNSFNIQNLNVNYAFTDKFSMAAGYFSTFVGYEVISPVGNYNYSTSYLFTNGPFQNAGIKATYAFTPKVSLMVGGFNESWNLYQARQEFGVNTLGAQLTVSPIEGWTAYLNVLSGYNSGTILDLTSSYQVTKSFKVGLNAADFTSGAANGGDYKNAGYTGGALYLSNSFNEKIGLGIRGEYFMSKDGVNGNTYNRIFDEDGDVLFGTGVAPKQSVVAATISANFKAGGLTFIPEFRIDNGSATQFFKENGSMTKSASQGSLAVVYAF